jgi:hypothetical protein
MPSSSSPEPQVIPVRRKEKKIKDKGKKKPNSKFVPERSKNEGSNPHWAYEPPSDAVLVDHNIDASEFDWDAIRDDDDTELWLVRIPDGVSVPRYFSFSRSNDQPFLFVQVKPKYLEGVDIECPSSGKSERVGTLVRKYATYDIWSIGEDDDQPIGGEEIKGLSPLLPRKRKSGKLFQGKQLLLS